MAVNPKDIQNSDPLLISALGRKATNKFGSSLGRITWPEICDLCDKPAEGVQKEHAQWVIPSTLESRVHADQREHGLFWILWADIDWKASPPRPMAEVASVLLRIIDSDIEVYATKSATGDRQKCRVLIPLRQPLVGGDWVISQRVLNSILEENGIEHDPSSEGAAQLLFLPNRGEWYDQISRRDGVCFDPMTAWSARIKAIVNRDAEEAAKVREAREAAKKRREGLREASVGRSADSIISTFNSTYTVEDILVQSGYDQRGNNFRHPHSETGSFSASIKNGRVHSLSSSDPLYTGGGGGGAHDAFSAFRTLCHSGDQREALIDAGDEWIRIGAESWNTVQRRKYAEEKAEERKTASEKNRKDRGPRQEFDYILSEVPHIEYGIDGFTSTGVTAFAGEAGLGKTSTIVPLCACIAHLIGDPFDVFTLNPVLRRKIVYITEDARQVQTLLYGLLRHQSKATTHEFHEWFHVFEADRISPDDLAHDIETWREEFRYVADDDLNGFIVEPLVVVDTSNANIDLDNENDNAEVGRAISAIKKALAGKGMAWLVCHLSKSVNREDISKLSVRGAGAWVGDVNATVFLISEQNIKDKRFLVLGKRRFQPDFTEMEITSELHSCWPLTPWGAFQSLSYMTCKLTPLTRRDSREIQAAKAMTETYSNGIIELLTREYESCQKEGQDWVGMTGGHIEKGVIGKAVNIRRALSEMTKAGKLKSKTEGLHTTAPTFYWIQDQERVSPSSPRGGRSLAVVGEKDGAEDQPLRGDETALRDSSPLRKETKDDGGCSMNTPPLPLHIRGRGTRLGQSKDKVDEAAEITPPPMAKSSTNTVFDGVQP